MGIFLGLCLVLLLSLSRAHVCVWVVYVFMCGVCVFRANRLEDN